MAAVGLGYTALTGNISLAFHYDDQKETLLLDTAADIKDTGRWKFKVRLGGISPNTVNVLCNLANSTQQTNGLALLGLAGQSLQELGTLSLVEASTTVDISGLYKRLNEITDSEMPQDKVSSPLTNVSFDETELVRAGMAPSEAHAAHVAIDNWTKEGGSLQASTNLAQPLPLFIAGNLLTPAFTNFSGFLAASKIKISN